MKKLKFYYLLLLVSDICYTMEKKELEHPAHKTKSCQLQINLWPDDRAQNSHDWRRIYEMMKQYEKEKEEGQFSIDQLCNYIKAVYTISKNSGNIWGDATPVFIPNSAKIDKKPLHHWEVLEKKLQDMTDEQLTAFERKLEEQDE